MYKSLQHRDTSVMAQKAEEGRKDFNGAAVLGQGIKHLLTGRQAKQRNAKNFMARSSEAHLELTGGK